MMSHSNIETMRSQLLTLSALIEETKAAEGGQSDTVAALNIEYFFLSAKITLAELELAAKKAETCGG